MPINVQWDNESQNAVRYDFTGAWTWVDFGTAVASAKALLASVPHEVDVIINFSESSALPANALFGFTKSTKDSSPNVRNIAVVTKTKFFEILLNMFTQLNSKNYRKVVGCRTLEEAR